MTKTISNCGYLAVFFLLFLLTACQTSPKTEPVFSDAEVKKMVSLMEHAEVDKVHLLRWSRDIHTAWKEISTFEREITMVAREACVVGQAHRYGAGQHRYHHGFEDRPAIDQLLGDERT